MSLQIPEPLLRLESNCGIFAVWMIFQHYGVNMDIDRLAQVCRHDSEDGAFGIGLAVALEKFGFSVKFYTDDDPHMHEKELPCYAEAQKLNIPVLSALSYQGLQDAVNMGRFVMVFYDTLQGVGNHSLIYAIDEQEICFFDSFDPMPAKVFERQRRAEGICRQALVIDGSSFALRCS